jgi:outer membrane protein OmpA-like peptidoglycan-associated protein
MGYIFAMRFCRRIVPRILGTFALALATLRADPGDVESSRDYTGFPRLQGFVITDYDEDSPAEFDFPVAQPLSMDADHVATVHVKGHRYVIRYELSPGSRTPSLFQTQRYYEKLASDAGFTVKKTGAVGDVTETFCRAAATHETWVYLEPAVTVNVLTIVESIGGPAPSPHIVAAPPTAPEAGPAALAPTPPAPAAPPIDPNDDSLYASLSKDGRVVLPFVFQPGKDELDDSSRPLVDRVVAMMKHHPDLFLRIEGHTDNLGDPDDALRLSAQQALAVQATLIAAHIDKKRLDAVGVGGLQPLADNNTAEGREKNRRIELVMWKKYPAFHAPAPDGQNYYPGAATSSSPARGKNSVNSVNFF